MSSKYRAAQKKNSALPTKIVLQLGDVQHLFAGTFTTCLQSQVKSVADSVSLAGGELLMQHQSGGQRLLSVLMVSLTRGCALYAFIRL